ncbi:MAG TPA: hypothetical protein VMM12_03670 [Longimicrobiales bacterium]|nr:hypothetical protein [Longimicrobiales bacterium]
MERAITYEGRPWRVWVNPAPAQDGAESGLDLVFSDGAGRQIRHPVGPALLRVLSRHGLEVDELLLREALAVALQAQTNGAPGGVDAGA